MRTQVPHQEQEDLTGQAGWVYTDLMLALMVVFLATISFVPEFVNVNSDSKSDKYTYSKVLDQSLNVVYESFDSNLIKSDINRFKSNNGIPADADIVYIQYVGGYAAASEAPSIAISRALAFSQKLDRADSQLVKNAATTLSSSNVLKPNQVIVRFTFAITSKINK